MRDHERDHEISRNQVIMQVLTEVSFDLNAIAYLNMTFKSALDEDGATKQ